MSDPSPHERRARASELGRDPNVTNRALARIDALDERSAPVLTLGELALRTGASPLYLRDVVARNADPYLEIDRPKKDGRTRPIAAPEPMLKDVQKWILDHVLGAAPRHPSSWAYRKGRSSVACARQHVGAAWLVKLDLHDFFGTIDEQQVFSVFSEIGYPQLLSFELARICTRTPQNTFPSGYERGPYPNYPPGAIPQGAPTSGALANAVMASTDRVLARFATNRGMTYTRYSDDVVFSSSSVFSRVLARQTIAVATDFLAKDGFRVHRKKTTIVPPGARKVVLGVMLRDGNIAVVPEFRRRIEAHVRGVEKFGLVAHARHRGFRSLLLMIEHVYGCISFAEDVEPEYGIHVRTRWDAAIRQSGYPLPAP